MAGWLALNGVTAAQCAALIGQDTGGAAPDDPPHDRASLWPDVARDLARALPAQAGPVVARLVALARVDLAPDPARFPRAFTLADDGRGLPLVMCPTQGRLSDRLRLAHEVGHAVQYLAAGRADIPPILRETAAALAEDLICTPAATPDPGLRAALIPLRAARVARLLRRHGAALAKALAQPDAPYDYGWNYPPAVMLARRIGARPDLVWPVFSGSLAVSDV
jgi:hypothetical protein